MSDHLSAFFSAFFDSRRRKGTDLGNGLTETEFTDAEEYFSFRFPPDLKVQRAELANAVTDGVRHAVHAAGQLTNLSYLGYTETRSYNFAAADDAD